MITLDDQGDHLRLIWGENTSLDKCPGVLILRLPDVKPPCYTNPVLRHRAFLLQWVSNSLNHKELVELFCAVQIVSTQNRFKSRIRAANHAHILVFVVELSYLRLN